MSDKLCALCGKIRAGRSYPCDVCHKLFCSNCVRFLSLAHVGSMNVGKVCPECINTNKGIKVIDPDNPRYFNQGK